MAINFRTPRGYGKTSWAFQTRFMDGTVPSYRTRPASFLPVWREDDVRDDPITIPPGTFIGRLNSRDHSSIDPSFTDDGWLAPACPIAYKVTYGAADIGVTPDIDQDADTLVAAAADSTATLIVKPNGIAAKPYYAGWIAERYYNYDPDLYQTWHSQHLVVRIPAITANEKLVEAGDLVMLDATASPKWSSNIATSLPGRIAPYGLVASEAPLEWVVGRCVSKVLLGKQVTPNASQSLDTAIGVLAPRTLTNIDKAAESDVEANYNGVQGVIEGAPGMRLSGTSATLGRPAEMLYAVADDNGYFWALDIHINV